MIHFTLVKVTSHDGNCVPRHFWRVIKTKEPLKNLLKSDRPKSLLYGTLDYETGEIERDYIDNVWPGQIVIKTGLYLHAWVKSEDVIRELSREEIAELYRRVRQRNRKLMAATKKFLGR